MKKMFKWQLNLLGEEEKVRMLEVECEGTSKRWEKSYQMTLWLCFYQSSLFELSWRMNGCLCALVSRFIVANAILWVQKFRSFPVTTQPNGQKLCTRPKHRLIRFPPYSSMLSEWRSALSWSSLYECTKKDGSYDFMKSEYVKPWLQKQIWP